MTAMLFLVKNFLVKKEVWDDATTSPLIAKVCGKVFAHFHTN
jgi:hypothetical protein